jgi:glycosyltransferase involved in cell wall biosynthesis
MSDWVVIHDFCFDYGGAERVLEAVAKDVAPDALVFALAGDDRVVDRMGLTGRLQFLLPRRAVSRRNYRFVASALAWRLKNEVAGDNVLALSYAFAHFPLARQAKVVYCHSPMRQIWTGAEDYASDAAPWLSAMYRATGPVLRTLDRQAAATADAYVATSTAVQRRIRGCYARDASIIPPPIDTVQFSVEPGRRVPFTYAWAGRIVEPYKRVSLLLDAFRDMPDRTLLVAGDGRDAARLRMQAPPNVRFLGVLSTSELAELYRSVEALLFPSTDDFGMAPLEAMACGTPIVAHRSGGALDTVTDGRTGVFFDELSPKAVSDAISRLADSAIDVNDVRARAEEFSGAKFAERMKEIVSEYSRSEGTARRAS